MFKIKDKWELKVLEEYGFKKENAIFTDIDYYLVNTPRLQYRVSIENRSLNLFTGDFSDVTQDLSLLYRLIKDDIVEMVQNTKDEYSFEVGV